MFKSGFHSSRWLVLAALLGGCDTKQFYSELSAATVPGVPGNVGSQSTPNPDRGTPTPQPAWANQIFEVPAIPDPQVDLLFVVDSSSSMQDEQESLAQNFTYFINEFSNKNVDFRIGVTTTDVIPKSATNAYWSGTTIGRPYFGYVDPGPGYLMTRYGDAPKWLTKNTPSYISKFQMNARVGTAGSTSEQGLVATRLFAENTIPNPAYQAPNLGFLRNSALFAIVVLTDEDETLTGGQTAALRISLLKAALDNVKPRATTPGWSIDFVLRMEHQNPSYMEAAQEFGSHVISLYGNFAQDLIDLGSSIAQAAQSQYALVNVPIAGTISVSTQLNASSPAVVIPEDPVNGWNYIAAGNKIQINGSALASLPGKQLKIRYSY